MSDETPFIIAVVSHVEIEAVETTAYGDTYPGYVAAQPVVTLSVPGLENIRRRFPFQPDIGSRWRLEFRGRRFEVQFPERAS